MKLKYILVPLAIVAVSLVASVFSSSSTRESASRTDIQLPENSPEHHFSPILYDADQNDSMRCYIYIPPLIRNCHKKKQPDCHDNLSELMAHNNTYIADLFLYNL